MTMTVKLPALLEKTLRTRSAALGRPASELIREALQRYLTATEAAKPSAYELGKDLFGTHAGPGDLSAGRKAAFAQLLTEKQQRRQ